MIFTNSSPSTAILCMLFRHPERHNPLLVTDSAYSYFVFCYFCFFLLFFYDRSETFKHRHNHLHFYTIVLISVDIITTFRPFYPLTFIRWLFYSGNFNEILNWILYLFYVSRLFSFHRLCLRITRTGQLCVALFSFNSLFRQFDNIMIVSSIPLSDSVYLNSAETNEKYLSSKK